MVSDFSHNTGSVRAQHMMTTASFQHYGGSPGATWSYQAGRWTAPDNSSLDEFSTEPGPAQYYVDDILVPNPGGTVNELAGAIRNVRGWYAQVDSVFNNGTFSDPILLVAYVGGAVKQGLRIAYPNDRTNDTAPHPAVELLNNGNWHHGAPKDGACVALTPADYAVQSYTFPGNTSYDERGGRGAFGEPTSTTTTRGPAPSGGPSIPVIISTATVAPGDPVTKLGLSPTQSLTFSIKNGNETNQVSYTPYANDTIYDLLSSINGQDNTGVHAYFINGKVLIGNTNPGVTPANAFDFTDQDNTGLLQVFGSATPDVSEIHAWEAAVSANKFTLTTPLAQFAPKGLMEVGIELGYPVEDQTIGYIVGAGATLPNGATNLSTMGDLITAINAINSGTSVYAYLENGHLVVAVFDTTNQPSYILGARYADETAGLRPAYEIMFGASDVRNGSGFSYEDYPLFTALSELNFVGSAIPDVDAYPTVVATPQRIGDRSFTASSLVSALYPVGTLLMRYDDNGYTYQFTFLEVTATTTIQQIINVFGSVSMTLRFVDAQGDHASSGFLRQTSPAAGFNPRIVWWNRATNDYGVADRFFHDNGDDGTVPTNVAGQVT